MPDRWKERPALLEYWPDHIDVLLGLDENGSSDILPIQKRIAAGETISFEDKYFNLTGVTFNRQGYDRLKAGINDIKFTYWPEGMCDYKGVMKRVCFHSSEIRRRKYPFNTISNYEEFLAKISAFVEDMPSRIFSCFIDKEKHCRIYKYPEHPYVIAISFILERFCKRLNEVDKKAYLILESRGQREDKFVLRNIINLLENGTRHNRAEHFRNIEGVYFNPKWWAADGYKSSFVILEYADLAAFPIFNYARNNCQHKDQTFLIVEKKLYQFPHYRGWGLKIFP
ncbi:hypothetical protein MO973_19740 [Paenibacillus sp. TRM 82003]|nr:hypothetical protein [Paenibacillus sp. TRM 82003]